MISSLRCRVLLVVSLALPSPALAQVRASEIGTMFQMIDGTKISMAYSRPRARGRETLFGTPKVVRWDEVWTPGANMATTLDVNKDIKLDGHRVPKGTYSVWMVVRKSGDWTLVLDPKSKRYHMQPPDSNDTQVRFPVRVQEAPFTDVLTWSVPEIRSNGGTLAMQWGKVRVAMNLEVEPTLQTTIAEADARPFLGRYEYREKGPDSMKVKVLTVSYEDGTLKGRYDPEDNYFKKFALLRVAPTWFAPGVYDDKGQIYEVYRPEMTFEFTLVNGRAESLEVRTDDDKIEATAKRKP